VFTTSRGSTTRASRSGGPGGLEELPALGSAVGIFAAVAALFAGVGILFLVVGTRTRRSAREFDQRAVRVPGR
jgi:hypothetical protein